MEQSRGASRSVQSEARNVVVPKLRATDLLRIAGAGLLIASGAIHLDLYLTGYASIATIGWLFVVQAVAAFLLGLVIVVVRSPLASLAGALLAIGTLAGYLCSVGVGLFGFREVSTTAGIAAGIIEVAAVLSLLSSVAIGDERDHLLSRGSRIVVAPAGVAAAACLGLVLGLAAPQGTASGQGSVVVERITVPGFGQVLAAGNGDAVYAFLNAHGRPVHCTGSCLSIWPPLEVPASVHHVAAGPGVAGHLGLAAVSPTTEQVTDNGDPLYLYVGDSGSGQVNGERIVSFGGTWYLARASATTAATTPVT